MEIIRQFQQLCHLQIRGLLLTTGIVVSIVILGQVATFPYENYTSVPSKTITSIMVNTVGNITFLNSSKSNNSYSFHEMVIISNASKSEEEAWHDRNTEDTDALYETDKSWKNLILDKSLAMRNVRSADNSSSLENDINVKLLPPGEVRKSEENFTQSSDPGTGASTSRLEYLDEDSRTSVSPRAAKVSQSNNTVT